jgi:hypothetical protein
LQLAAASIIEHRWPRVFRFSYDHCIGVTRGFLRKCRRVRSAEYYGHSSPTEFARKTISVKSGRRGRRNPHKICRLVEAHRFNNLVDVGHTMLTRRESCDQGHGQLRELNQASATQAT